MVIKERALIIENSKSWEALHCRNGIERARVQKHDDPDIVNMQKHTFPAP